MDIDYNKIKTFVTVVRFSSVTSAAKELNRTQSAVSQSLKALEGELGLRLLDKEGRRLKLTRNGELIYRAAEQRLRAIEEQLTSITQTGGEVGGLIELGILQDHSTKMQDEILHHIASFQNKYPAVKFAIHLGTSREIEEALLNRAIDVGFLINFQQRHRFDVFEVATEEHLVVTSADYAKDKNLSNIEEIINASLIDIDPHFTCLNAWVKKHKPKLLDQLQQRRPDISIDDFWAIKALVLQNRGIAVLPRYLIEEELEKGTIIPILPKLDPLKVGVDCAVEQGKEMRLVESTFLESFSPL